LEVGPVQGLVPGLGLGLGLALALALGLGQPVAPLQGWRAWMALRGLVLWL